MNNTVTWLMIAVFLGMIPVPSHAEDPVALKNKANTNVMTAERIMHEAVRLVQERPTIESKRLAVSLFTQAGQLFEEAAGLYQVLIPNYARPEDAQNAAEAMQFCIDSIKKLKKTM